MADTGPINIMGAGLSGLAAATILAKAGKEVHVHDIREESGARFDGDFQALENWSMDSDFFEQMADWGFDTSEFKATEFKVVDLIHPDDTITQAKSPRIAYRIVERGTSEHTIDQGIKRHNRCWSANPLQIKSQRDRLPNNRLWSKRYISGCIRGDFSYHSPKSYCLSIE